MSDVEHELRRVRDDNGVTHWYAWDYSSSVWYQLCGVSNIYPGGRSADHDTRSDCITCVRCVHRSNLFLSTGYNVTSVINDKSIIKVNFNIP